MIILAWIPLSFKQFLNWYFDERFMRCLLADPKLRRLGPVDALLKLKESIEETLGSGRAARHVNVNWHHPITASDNSVAVMIVSEGPKEVQRVRLSGE